jgi:hypothetical protein
MLSQEYIGEEASWCEAVEVHSIVEFEEVEAVDLV